MVKSKPGGQPGSVKQKGKEDCPFLPPKHIAMLIVILIASVLGAPLMLILRKSYELEGDKQMVTIARGLQRVMTIIAQVTALLLAIQLAA